MSIEARLRDLLRRARTRVLLIVALRWLPWLAVLALLCLRLSHPLLGSALGAAAAVFLGMLGWRRIRRIDSRWLIRRLDAKNRTFEDSSDLLFAEPADLGPLQRLQQQRVQQRLLDDPGSDPRPAVRWRPLAWNALAALLVATLITLWPRQAAIESVTPTRTPVGAGAQAPVQSLQAALQVVAPAYTGLSERTTQSLDAEVPQDSTLRWTLRFALPPSAVRLRFLDGETLALQQEGDAWRGERVLSRSTLYTIELEGAEPLPGTDPHRIEVIDDQPPKLVIGEPQRTLTVLDAAARSWSLRLEASDDYGLGAAQLQLTLAQGSGEQIAVSERRIALRGHGDARLQTFDHRVDLAALGFARGDDLIARIEVRDNRQPQPNVTRSASFILRWPAEESSDGSGVEGLVQQTLPAYFRSQRQIIIDTEALLAESPQLSADTVVERSDRIGVDQRILRLRYGQFLGEETEDASPPPPSADGDEEEHHEGDGHDHGEAGTESDPVSASELIAAAGHLHDIPEAATLLDPTTRRLLRAALDAMWQAEGELRLGQPAKALPHEYRALDNIKRVQQASRIYLARVGLELPQIDPARRLTGDRPSGSRRVDPLVAIDDHVDAPAAAWQALRDGSELPLDALAVWLHDADDDAQRLDLLTVIERLRSEPDCASCRERLAALLWPRLTPPAAAPALRPRADALGRAYLDALPAPGDTR